MSLNFGQLKNLERPTDEELQRHRRLWCREHPIELRLRRQLRRRFPDLLRLLGDAPTFSSGEEPISRSGIEFGRGWLELFKVLCLQLVALTPPSRRRRYVIVQTKEKFGELRVYLSSGSAAMRAAIRGATMLSTVVCEDCGKAATMRKIYGWFHTLCDTHARRHRFAAERRLVEYRAKARPRA